MNKLLLILTIIFLFISCDKEKEIPLGEKGGLCLDGNVCKNGLNLQCKEGICVDNCKGYCKNGGKCVVTNDSNNMICECASGFIGTTCEEVNYCKDNPCQNEGKCKNTSDSYICECKGRFDGKNCEHSPFVTTWKTNNDGPGEDNEVIIKTNADFKYDYLIDCDSDGQNEAENVRGDYTCKYDKPGVYKVSIRGKFPNLYNYYDYLSNNKKLLSIDQWGNIK